MGGSRKTLKELADEFGVQGEYRALYKDAQLGRQYRKELENDVVRLCLALELGAEAEVLRSIVKTAPAEDLQKLRTALDARLGEMMPVMTQLGAKLDEKETIESGFLI